MKTILIFSLAVATANSVFADIYSSAIRQARNVAQQNPPVTAPPPVQQPPPSQAAPPPNPQLEATLQNISNLRLDFDNIGKLTPTNSYDVVKNSLMTNLFLAAQGIKPSEATTARLVEHLTGAIAGRDVLVPQHTKLAQDVHAIFNGSHLSADQQETLFAEIQTILQTGGVTTDVALNIIGDLKVIATETSK